MVYFFLSCSILSLPFILAGKLRKYMSKKKEVAWDISCLVRNVGDFCSAKRKKEVFKKKQSARKSKGQRLDQEICPSWGQRGESIVAPGAMWSHLTPGREEKSSRNRGQKPGLGRWDLWLPPQILPISGIASPTQRWLSPRPQNYGIALGQNPKNN